MRTGQTSPIIRIFSIIAAGVFSLCLLLPDPVGALSREEERILGERFLDAVQKQFSFVADDFVGDYLDGLGQYLANSFESPSWPFRFYVVENGSLNAFAAPGGHVFVFSGIVEMLENADELAAVISHEIAHVSARHIANRFEQGKRLALATLAGMLAGAFLGGKEGTAIAMGSAAAGIQKQLAYSREDERQADQLGFRHMDSAGFDPSAMIAVLRKLERSHMGAEGIPPYLLTHPGGPERISNTEVMLSEYRLQPENRETARFRKHFDAFKTVLRAKTMEPREAEKLFQQELRRDPNSSLAHLGMGVVLKERSDHVKAADHFERALQGQSDPIPILRNLGETYQLMGKDREAISVFEKALGIDGQDKASQFLMATSYMNLDDYAKAIVFYERLASLRPVKDEVFYQLGVSYGRENKLALAHYNFGVYFKRLRQMEKARFHFLKAEELALNNPALKSRIQDAKEGMR